jgi:hypothetical protein
MSAALSRHAADIEAVARGTLADEAIALGLPVFPCDADKKPLTPSGFKDASRDPAAIRRMFSHRAAALIGVPTGPASDAVVVDVDTKDGKRGLEWLERRMDALPNTRAHQTRSGGLHLLFRQPEGIEIPSSQSRIAPGVDVRGSGGYIIVPPSPGYVVAVAAPLTEMPTWLAEACRRRLKPRPAPSPRRAPLDARDAGVKRLLALVEFVADAREGQRNSRLFWAACRAAEAASAGDMPAAAAFAALEETALATGLPPAEAQRTIQSARRTAYGSAAA